MKKVFSILLALIMCLSLLPTMAMATEGDVVAKIGEDEYATLAEAFQKAAEVATSENPVTIEIIEAGSYELPNPISNLTIKSTVADIDNDKAVQFDKIVGYGQSTGKLTGVKFENVRFNFGTSRYSGFQHSDDVTFTNCTLSGVLHGYGAMKFENCKLYAPNSDYSMYTYGGSITYTGCDFYGTGKYLSVYSEAGYSFTPKIVVENCVFHNTGSSAGKAGINVKECDSDQSYAKMLKFDVEVSGCTTDGAFPAAGTFDASKQLYVVSPVVQIDDRKIGAESTEVIVKLDGVQVYPEPVAQIDTTKYATLAAAIANVKPDETITLLKNSSGNGIVVPENSNFTVNFNDFTYTIDGTTVGSTGTETNGFQLLKNSTITFKNGTLTSNKAKKLIQNYSNLTLENMTLDGSSLQGTAPYTLSNNYGDVNIKGNTSIKARDGGFAFDSCGACWTNQPYGNGAIVTVDTTGTIDGKIECCATIKIKNGTFNGDITLDSTAGDNCPKSVTVTGGTFSSNPIDYVAKGNAVTKDGDTYTVAAATNTAAVEATKNINDGKLGITVSEITPNTDNNVKTNTIDVSSLDDVATTTKEVSVAKTVLATVVKNDANKPVEFKVAPNTAVEFNKEAVQAIAGNMAATTTGDTITLVVTPNANVINPNEVAAKNSVVAAGNSDAKVVTLELMLNSTNLFPEPMGSTDAEATVTVPFIMPSGCNRVNVYYLNSDTGAAEYVGTASTANGAATFTVEHFSSYALVPTYVGSHGGGSYTPSAAQTVTTDLPAGSITKVTVDGKVVDSKYYTISGGNVTLTDAYIKTLSNGKHTVAIENATHISKATITVNNAANAATVKSGKTGDAGILLYGVLAVSSVLGMGWVGKKKIH